jgi:glycerol-3-phosphate dehydrogenase
MADSSSPQSFGRDSAAAALAGTLLDVLVIGGGIVGAGVARDAAMRGLKVGLIEQHDFAFGTSSRSSRLLHGGLRYLAQGRIGLVHEASTEKRIVQRIAPHLVQPLAFVFPGYRGNPSWQLWQLKIGVKLYDVLCHRRNFGRSEWWSAQRTEDGVPGIAVAGLAGAVRYFDALTNDARLVLDTLRSAARHGAILLNYCRFDDASRDRGWRASVEDLNAQRGFEIRARTIVNAAGPWAGRLPRSRVRLRLTKGIHVVVNRSRLAVPDAVVITEGRRILFAIPWGSRTILGTTDTDYDGSLDDVSATAGEIAQVLDVTNRHFPEAGLQLRDVRGEWAGLRPLIADGKSGPSELSRSHQIRMPEPGWWDIAGGKLTTYRRMAEQTVNQMAQWLRRHETTTTVPCRTADEPLLSDGEADGISGILPPPVSRAAVEHYCRAEWAVHLSDVMLRRAGWHFYLDDAVSVAEQVAGWMQELHGWTAAERDAELRHYRTAPAAPRAEPVRGAKDSAA